MLTIEQVHTSYGGIRALRGVSLTVGPGEMVALIGSNGAGKSTLLNSISGVTRPQSGEICFDGHDICGASAWAIARRGLLQVPEGRQIVPNMTVADNLSLGASALRGRPPTYSPSSIFELFPILAERGSQMAGTLSGGQQQMLAIGRALMGSPRLLLLDEPSLGLAPLIVSQVFAALKQVNKSGLSMLLVEQNAAKALEATDRAYIIERGQIVRQADSASLSRDPDMASQFFGTAHTS